MIVDAHVEILEAALALAIDPQARVDLTTEITDDMRASIERAIARRKLDAS